MGTIVDGRKAQHQILSQNDRHTSCKADNIVFIAVLGLSSEANGTGSADDPAETAKEVEPGEQDAKTGTENSVAIFSSLAAGNFWINSGRRVDFFSEWQSRSVRNQSSAKRNFPAQTQY